LTTFPSRRAAVVALVILTAVFATAAPAGITPSGCDDLSTIPATPDVDFRSDIAPLFDQCDACHGADGFAGLDLRPGEAYGNLVDVESTTWPGRFRVEPRAPDRSVLLGAINCADPGEPDFRMGNVTRQQQALVRDWIAQGALMQPAPRSVPVLSPTGTALALLAILIAGLVVIRRRTG